MTTNWLRRTAVLAVCASAALLAACGSSTVESAISPKRIYAFGDGISDLGQTGNRYTVNDGSINIWTQQLASSYGLTLTTAAAGGTSYAVGNARVTVKPDAAGDATTPTIADQVTTYLASNTPASTDVLVISGGTSDIVADFARFRSGNLTSAQVVTNATQAGNDLGAQVRRLVNAGGRYVVTAGTYDLGRSPLAIGTGQAALLSQASSALNSAFLVSIADLGSSVLAIDAAFYFNLLTGLPGNYSFNDGVTQVCTSIDPGVGIGTGTGQVNSKLCTPSTIVPGLDYSRYVFADNVYFTPQAQRLFGTYAYDRLRTRF